jgi:putative mRNA 3-end processing factor
VFCYSLGKTQRILAELYAAFPERRGETVLLHSAAVELTALYRQQGVAMLETEPLQATDPRPLAGRLLLAPPAASDSLRAKLKSARFAFASGWMQLRGMRRRANYDAGFVLSDHADWPGLIQSIRDSGAQRVLPTHGNTDVLVRYLREQGLHAAALKTELGGEN